MLARLGSGGSEQRNHLHHRREDCAIGLRSRESFLHRALRRQPSHLAQDRGSLTTPPAATLNAAEGLKLKNAVNFSIPEHISLTTSHQPLVPSY
jgi:hypothetical protein